MNNYVWRVGVKNFRICFNFLHPSILKFDANLATFQLHQNFFFKTMALDSGKGLPFSSSRCRQDLWYLKKFEKIDKNWTKNISLRIMTIYIKLEGRMIPRKFEKIRRTISAPIVFAPWIFGLVFAVMWAKMEIFVEPDHIHSKHFHGRKVVFSPICSKYLIIS